MMIKNKQYNGPLTASQAAEGIRVASCNAYALYRDAQLLHEHQRYARAVSLSALAIEEAGKVSILRAILMEHEPKALKELWRAYRRHTAKNTQWIVPELIQDGARKLEDFRQITDEKSQHMSTLDTLKQLGFYTDAFHGLKWSSPDKAVDEVLSGSLVHVAQVMAGQADHRDNQDELELWVKHMRPVWKTSMSAMKNALNTIYREAAAAGIVTAGKAAEMEAFTKNT